MILPVVFMGVKLDLSHLGKNRNYTSTHQYAFMAWCSVKKHRDSFTFTFTFTFTFAFALYRLRAFENTVLRKILGPRKEEVAGGWRRLHSEELHNLYALPNIIRVIKSRVLR
jgi:hypothetical protein